MITGPGSQVPSIRPFTSSTGEIQPCGRDTAARGPLLTLSSCRRTPIVYGSNAGNNRTVSPLSVSGASAGTHPSAPTGRRRPAASSRANDFFANGGRRSNHRANSSARTGP